MIVLIDKSEDSSRTTSLKLLSDDGTSFHLYCTNLRLDSNKVPSLGSELLLPIPNGCSAFKENSSQRASDFSNLFTNDMKQFSHIWHVNHLLIRVPLIWYERLLNDCSVDKPYEQPHANSWHLRERLDYKEVFIGGYETMSDGFSVIQQEDAGPCRPRLILIPVEFSISQFMSHIPNAQKYLILSRA